MKVYVIFLMLFFLSVQSMKLMRKSPSFYTEEVIDENELGDFQKLLNKFNLISSSTSSNLRKLKDNRQNLIPKVRFTEADSKDESEDGDSSQDVKFPDDNNGSNGVKDQELKRIEGLSNGLILYNSKRTVNTETSDYSHLYFDLLEN